MRLAKSISTTTLLFISATALHAAYRAGRLRTASAPVEVSSLRPGAVMPSFESVTIKPSASGADLASPICRVAVVFNPTCPHCHEAAARAKAANKPDRIPTTWISTVDDSGAQRFATIVPDADAVVVSDVAGSALQINAVPARFLIGADNRIRDIAAYTGREADSTLKRQCMQ